AGHDATPCVQPREVHPAGASMSSRITLADLRMLKFWKKKNSDKDNVKPADATDAPAEPGLPQTPATAPTADTAAQDASNTQAAPRRGWRGRLSGSGFARGLSSLFARHPKLDDALLDELETVLITADVGVNASMELVEDLRARMHK